MKRLSVVIAASLSVLLFSPMIARADLFWPLPNNRKITATHGEFRSWISNRIHRGVDVASGGEDVLSISTGVITAIDESAGLVEVDYTFQYRHMRNIPAYELNTSISQGQYLGISSDAGAPGSIHLHFATGDMNPLLVAEFNVPDTILGEIASPYQGDTSSPFYAREPGKPDRAITEGDTISVTSPEFVVNAFDKTNYGSFVGFSRIKSTLDGVVLKEHSMLLIQSDENTYSSPPASDIFASGGSAHTLRGAPYFYRMGIKANISKGQHELCVEGYDLNRGVEEIAAPSRCVRFLVAGVPTILIVDSNQEGNLRAQGPFAGSAVTLANRLWIHNGSASPAGVRFIASALEGVSSLKVVGLDAAGVPDENKLYADINVLSSDQEASFSDGTLPDARGYLVSARAASTTTVYFGVDSVPPALQFGLNVSPTFEVGAVGISSDGISGVAETVFMPGWPSPGDQSRVGSGSPGPPQAVFQFPIPMQEFVGSGASGESVRGAAGFIIARDVGGLAAAFNPIYVSQEDGGFSAGGSVEFGSEWLRASWNDSTAANRLNEYHVRGGCVHRSPLPPVCEGANPPSQCVAGSPSGPCGSWSFKIRSVGLDPSATVPITVDGAFIGDTQIAGGAVSSTITFDVSGSPALFLGATVMARVDVVDGTNPYFTPAPVSVQGILRSLFIQASINPAAPVISTGIFPSVDVGNTRVYFGEVSAGPERRVWISQVPVTPPDGWRFVPGNSAVASDIATMASFTGGVHVRLRYNAGSLNETQAAQVKMWHRGPNGWEDVTTFVDVETSEVWGESATASPFAVLISSAALGSAAASASSVTRISSATASLSWPAGGNPAGIRYFVAYSTSSAADPCMTSVGSIQGAISVFGETAEIGGLLPGTGYRFQVCTDALGAEGCATPVAVVTPQAGEPESVSPAFLTCDGGQASPDLTPPVTTIGFSGFFISTTGAAGVINDRSSVTLTGVDLGVGQVQTFYAVDPSSAVMTGGLNAATTGAFSLYGVPFALIPGRRVVAYGSVDGAGNYELLRSTDIVVETFAVPVVFLDTAPPRTELQTGQPSGHGEGPEIFVTDQSRLGFIVADDKAELGDSLGVGATQTFYTTDGGAFELFSGSFSLVAEGTHTVSYFSIDREGNAEAVKVQPMGVDLTAPVVTFTSSGTLYALAAEDPVVAGVASGIEGIQYVVDIDPEECDSVEADTSAVQGTCANPEYTGPFALTPGTHTVVFAAFDRVEHEVVSSSFVVVGAPAAGAVLTPGSGPIGVPFALSGAGFGIYGGANTRIKFGTLAAPVSVWNDTTIVGTIPGLSTGVHPVTVERQNASSVTIVSAGAFTATDLSSATFSISSGPIGVPFTFTGSGFGPYAGTLSRVLVGGTTAPLSVWNDTTITGTIPGVAPGARSIVLQRATSDGGLSTSVEFAFEVTVPSITAVVPSSGPIGTVFTLTGFSFGPYNGTNTQVLIGGATSPLSLWNDRIIMGTVPGALLPGVHSVVVERRTGDGGIVQSGAASIEVSGLALVGLTPSSGPIGVPFTITGAGFGTYNGTNTRVKFGSVVAPVSLWNDTVINGTIPALPPGTLDVVVERQQGSGVTQSALSSFTVLVPSISSLTPASGPIGIAFTIKGAGFGPYAGTNSRALFGGVAAALSLWNDTTITGTIPALPSGVQPVWLERSAGSGVSSSATSYFTVTTPAVAALTPSSAPIGAPFTITGASFGTYAGTNTRVKFNGVAAPISVWNDATISGTVPGALSPGETEVVVERVAGAGISSSAVQAFLVLAPAISTIAPAFGPVGTVVTLTGSGFGPYAGTLTKVLVGGATVPVSVWNDATIRWTVTSSFADGEYPVVVRRSPAGGTVDSASATFTVGTGYGGASFGFAAALSLAATPDSHFEGDLTLSSAAGGRIDTPAKAAVDIPANAMEADTEITLKRLRSDGFRAAAADEIAKRPAGEPIEFGPEGTRFLSPVTIELPYDPALVADEGQIAIHYYDPLRREWEELPSVVDRARKVVKARTDHFSIYQPMGAAPMTAAQDEFYFRDSYAFPNPSRGGALVTFRIQPGLADSVEVRVYDLSGRKIHGSSDFTFLGAIDDGNGKGAQNTYDHAWSVSGVGSGVYNYVIKASRAGHDPISKSGKVGVVK